VTSSTRDLDVAKDRLVDSLSTARDATITAVREDIAPAVAAAVGAAKEASGPVRAEAATRASDAVKALRGSEAAKVLRATGSEAAKAVRDSDLTKKARKRAAKTQLRAMKAQQEALKALQRKQSNRGRKLGVFAAVGAAALAAVAVMKRRSGQPDTSAYPTPPAPGPVAAAPPATDAAAPAVEDPTVAQAPTANRRPAKS
jgi:hypothetical protein